MAENTVPDPTQLANDYGARHLAELYSQIEL